MNEIDTQALAKLIACQNPDFALQQEFYRDPDIFEHEIREIFLRSWLYVGHISDIVNIGDYFLFEIAGESIVIVRSAPDAIVALVNVCRHRGSRVCVEQPGNAKRFVCGYHGWTYGLDGQLLGAAQMPDGFDKAKFPLKQVQLRLMQGLIFINFDPNAAAFDAIANDLTAPLEPYGLDRARVAHRQNYPIAANWKLAVENYCECYHCAPAHPEYTAGHGRAMPDDQVAEAGRQVLQRAAACGLTEHCIDKDWLDAGGLGIDRSFDRYPLLAGHVTGSRDGHPLAPLLGDIKAYDGGCTDIHIGPVTFALAYCDHVVTYRFIPRAVDLTDCEITWLVNESAREGTDYHRDELVWLWDVTTIADKRIIENNQAGMNSRLYEPGPYSEMEDYTRRFIQWYVHYLHTGK